MQKARFSEILDAAEGKRILVVGDLMLDRYILGTVNRISPEAPVPVVHVRTEKAVPGGASNVALNIRSLQASAIVAGVTGADKDGDDLIAQLEHRGIDTTPILREGSVRTTVKTRVIAERQQVVRVDWEDGFEFNGETFPKFEEKLRNAVREADGVILEDYGKGVIGQKVVDAVVEACAQKGIPVGLDPKENHELAINGITVATPNRREAFIAAGLTETRPGPNPLEDVRLLQAGDRILEKWRTAMLVITLGDLGMLLMAKGQKPMHVPTRAREVFDVSGAGDTVIATCVLAIAAGASFHEAAELANYAAGIVVAKLGTATCSRSELLGAVEDT